MNLKKLCLDLAYSNTEDEVIKILDRIGLWQSEKYWKNYGDNETCILR